MNTEKKVQLNSVGLMPFSLETEKAALACALVGNKYFIELTQILKVEDFFELKHRLIYDAMFSLYKNSINIDSLNLVEALKKNESLENAGGLSYLNELSTVPFYLSAVKDYAKIVAEKAQLRRLINLFEQAYKDSISEKEVADDIIINVTQNLYQLKQGDMHLGPRLVESIIQDQLDELADPERLKKRSLKTGFIDFDNIIGGLNKGTFNILAARPAMGKSAFAINIGRNCAMNHKVVIMFSLEMSQAELGLRLFSSEAMVESKKITNPSTFATEMPKLADAIRKLGPNFKFFVDDRAALSTVDIMGTCRQIKMQHGLDLVIIDYLQLMSSPNTKRDNRQQEISEISRSLKLLAKELNVPVIALSQLSRACELRADKKPLLSDLRESGSIEQDADAVFFLYRSDYYNRDVQTDKKDAEEAELIIAKNRSGATGTIKLLWFPNYVRFMDHSSNALEEAAPPAFLDKNVQDFIPDNIPPLYPNEDMAYPENASDILNNFDEERRDDDNLDFVLE